MEKTQVFKFAIAAAAAITSMASAQYSWSTPLQLPTGQAVQFGIYDFNGDNIVDAYTANGSIIPIEVITGDEHTLTTDVMYATWREFGRTMAAGEIAGPIAELHVSPILYNNPSSWEEDDPLYCMRVKYAEYIVTPPVLQSCFTIRVPADCTANLDYIEVLTDTWPNTVKLSDLTPTAIWDDDCNDIEYFEYGCVYGLIPFPKPVDERWDPPRWYEWDEATEQYNPALWLKPNQNVKGPWVIHCDRRGCGSDWDWIRIKDEGLYKSPGGYWTPGYRPELRTNPSNPLQVFNHELIRDYIDCVDPYHQIDDGLKWFYDNPGSWDDHSAPLLPEGILPFDGLGSDRIDWPCPLLLPDVDCFSLDPYVIDG